MLDQILDKALDTDVEVIRRHSITGTLTENSDGTVTIDEAVVSLLNPVLQEGSSFNKANMLPDDIALLLGLDPDDDPQVKDAFGAILGYYGDSFSTADWSQISAVSASKKASTVYNIGDTRTETLSTGETVVLRIEDFDHDVTEDGETVGITIGMVDCFNTTRQVNSSNTNSGGYTSSAIRASMSSIKSSFSEALQQVIKPVVKLTQAGSQSSTLVETVEELFLLSFTEIGYEYSYVSPGGEGTPYPLFTDANSLLKQVNGVNAQWWLRSPALYSSSIWVSIYTNQGWETAYPTSYCGVSVCFCV